VAAAPFAWGDFTWMNGQNSQKDYPLKAFGDAVTMSLYLDVNYGFSSRHPRDDTLTGGASISRHNEIQVNLASIGFELNYKNVIGRIALQYGEMLTIVHDQDPSAQRGRSLAISNLKYLREAAGGYHFDVSHGLNAEAGIFLSYISMDSYLLADNWSYERPLITEVVPFYLQGIRVQYFPTDRLKIEPWLINGWQSYGKYDYAPAGGLSVRWSPVETIAAVANFYLGTDTKDVASRIRFHHDDSFQWRYHAAPKSSLFTMGAFSLNNHVGFESGGAGLPGPDHAHVVASSLSHRVQFAADELAFTVRGEVFSNPSRYLVQYPPPGFATGPGTKALQVWGLTGTFDVMPTDYFLLRFEGCYRRANDGLFAGPGGTTSPDGYQPAQIPPTFIPSTRKDQFLAVAAVNLRL
jgi:hypothetical protein